MREMKDSGVEWLGEVPAEWGFDRLGGFFSLRSEKVSDEDYIPLSVTKGGVVPQLSHVAKSDDHANRKLVCKGDFAINSRSDRRNSCGFASRDGSVSLINTICVPRGEIESRYFGYLFDSSQWSDEFYSWGHGIVADLWTTGWNDMKKILLPVPPLDEQRRIADFLDEKCGEVDRAVSAAEQSIEEYKTYKNSVVFQAATKGLDVDVPMRDSGVGWLGEVPAEWGVVPGKRILMLLHRPVEDGDDVVTCFRDGEVTLRANRRTEGFTIALKEIGYQGVEPGDLVVHGMDGFAGSIGISDSRGKASPVLNVMGSDQNKRFLMYYMRGLAYRDVYMALSDGIRVRSCNLSWKKIGNLPFVLPSLPVQSRIADYLDEKCGEVDAAIVTKQAIIADLKAYKQSLIYEVVTGKREV